jgi:hypothetical protein
MFSGVAIAAATLKPFRDWIAEQHEYYRRDHC